MRFDTYIIDENTQNNIYKKIFCFSTNKSKHKNTIICFKTLISHSLPPQH